MKPKVTTSLRQELSISPRVAAQIRVKLTEYAEIRRKIKELEAKNDAIKEDVQQKFIDADELDALMAGTDIDGIKVKMVVGTSKRINKAKVKKKLIELGEDASWLDEEGHDEVSNAPYIKITSLGEKD
jgi:seryl-tRNA synthetase